MGKKVKKAVKKTASAVKAVASFVASRTPAGRVATAVSSVVSSKKKGGRRKMTIASIKRKIALLKAKKELAKVRGY